MRWRRSQKTKEPIMVAAAANAKLLPSPAEIHQECALIRQKWTVKERLARRIGGRLRTRLLELICDQHELDDLEAADQRPH
jgi:hypothetical protein